MRKSGRTIGKFKDLKWNTCTNAQRIHQLFWTNILRLVIWSFFSLVSLLMCLAFLFILSIIIMIIFVNRMIEWKKKENPSLFCRSFVSKPKLTENMVQKPHILNEMNTNFAYYLIVKLRYTQFFVWWNTVWFDGWRICVRFQNSDNKLNFMTTHLTQQLCSYYMVHCLLAEIVMGALTLTCDMCTVCTAH